MTLGAATAVHKSPELSGYERTVLIAAIGRFSEATIHRNDAEALPDILAVLRQDGPVKFTAAQLATLGRVTEFYKVSLETEMSTTRNLTTKFK